MHPVGRLAARDHGQQVVDRPRDRGVPRGQGGAAQVGRQRELGACNSAAARAASWATPPRAVFTRMAVLFMRDSCGTSITCHWSALALVVEHRHFEPARPPRQLLADPAQSDDAQSAVVQAQAP